MKYSNKQIDKLISGIYDGEITVGDMPESLYYAIADYLKKSLYEGFGGSLIDFDGKPLELLTELRENIYLFSGAKTYQTVKAMESMLTEDGEKRSFKDFKEFARNEYDLFNVTWARTEYDTAIGQGQNAYLWTKIQADKDVLPLLQYTAVIDANTSDICAPLNGIVKPVDDPFWDVFMPLNHHNCRCSVLQLSEGEISKDIKEETKQVAENMNDVFKNNVGKDGFVFPPDHPYFDVAPEDKKLAKENFGFDIPEKD